MPTEYASLRKGVTYLSQNVMLLNEKGQNQNNTIVNTILDPNQDSFNQYFKGIKLPDDTAFDYDLMARVMVDAVYIPILPVLLVERA